MEFLHKHVEALIFCSPKPITAAEIASALKEISGAEVTEAAIQEAVQLLETRYDDEAFSFQVYYLGGGYQFLTKPAYQASISIHLKQQNKKRLSTSAMETLAIIAYKQPITKGQIEQIRGVNCDYAVQKLLEKKLVEIKGKSDGVGRPLLYGTSQQFMEYFGINKLTDLPTPKDFSQEANTIGEELAE